MTKVTKGKIRRYTMIFLLIIVSLFLVSCLLLWFVVLSQADRAVLVQKPLSFETSDGARTYRKYVPGSITPDTKLVFVLDGFGGSGLRVAYYSGFHNAVRNAVVVYPDPLKPKAGQIAGWNAGFCCGSGWLENANDTLFLSSLAAELSRVHQLQDDTFYVAGFSNGAFMAQKLAADLPKKVRAAVSIAGTIGTDRLVLKPSAPIPILLVHGRNDRIVPFQGGAGSSDQSFSWKSAEVTAELWRSTNGAQAEVATYWHDGGHEWPDWRTYNVWNRKPSTSVRTALFFDR